MRTLTFSYKDAEVPLGLESVSRDKLYGYAAMEVYDEEGQLCELATLAGDGRTIVPKGGTAQVYLDEDGRWLDRADLTPVAPEGTPIETVPSSFDAPIPLDTEATPDDLLSCSIRLIYHLLPEQDLPPALLNALTDGRLFTFPFSYRGGLTYDRAFLLTNEAGTLFMLAGTPLTVDYLTHEQPAAILPEEEEEDELDFDLM